MMILDLVNESIEEFLPLAAREMDVSWHVQLEPSATPAGEQVLTAVFFFATPSPLVGQVLWHVQLVLAGDVFQPKVLEQLVLDSCEALRSRKAALLAGPEFQ